MGAIGVNFDAEDDRKLREQASKEGLGPSTWIKREIKKVLNPSSLPKEPEKPKEPVESDERCIWIAPQVSGIFNCPIKAAEKTVTTHELAEIYCGKCPLNPKLRLGSSLHSNRRIDPDAKVMNVSSYDKACEYCGQHFDLHSLYLNHLPQCNARTNRLEDLMQEKKWQEENGRLNSKPAPSFYHGRMYY